MPVPDGGDGGRAKRAPTFGDAAPLGFRQPLGRHRLLKTRPLAQALEIGAGVRVIVL